MYRLLIVMTIGTLLGCGPNQADIDRTKKLNELSDKRQAEAALEYLESHPPETNEKP